MKQVFVTLLSFERSFPQNVNRTTMLNQPCLTRSNLVCLNPDKVCYSPFVDSSHRYDRNYILLFYSSAVIFDLSDRSCISNITENVNMVSNIV